MIRLDELDQPGPTSPATHTLAANLAALRASQPDVAGALTDGVVDGYELGESLDGSTSAMLCTGFGSRRWLGGTAAPRTRAVGILRSAAIDGRSVFLPDVGAGYEAAMLLDRLPSSAAVFATAASAAALRGVLAIHDFSTSIAVGRLYFFIAPLAGDALADLLGRHAGLLPPAVIIGVPGVSRSAIDADRATLLRAATRAAQDRAAELAQFSPVHPASTRVAFCSFAHSTRTDASFCELAADELSQHAPATAICGHSPRDAHPLSVARRLASFRASRVVCVGADPPAELRRIAPVACWHTRAPSAILRESLDGATLHLAASPTIERALRDVGAPPDRTRAAYWSAPREWLERDPRPIAADQVVLLADVPEVHVDHVGIRQPTHRVIWDAARAAAVERWNAGGAMNASEVLRRAEHRVSLRVADPPIRDAMLRRLAMTVIPRTVLTQIAQSFAGRVSVVGGGWTTAGVNAKPLGLDAFAAARAEPAYAPLAFVLDVPDAWTPAAVLALAMGWPLCVIAISGEPIDGQLPRALLSSNGLQVARTSRDVEAFARAGIGAHARRRDRARAWCRAHGRLGDVLRSVLSLDACVGAAAELHVG